MGFDSDPLLHDLKLLVLGLFHFVLLFFMENSYHRRLGSVLCLPNHSNFVIGNTVISRLTCGLKL